MSLHNLPDILFQILIYAISFTTIAVVWLNHHHFISAGGAHTISINGVWLNFGMLFMISFVPTATAHLSEAFYKVENHIFYALATGLMVMFYAALQDHVTRDIPESIKARRMSWLSVICYFLAIPISFVSVYLSGIIFLFIPTIYFIQTRRG